MDREESSQERRRGLPGRRAEDLQVVDTDGALTTSELKDLKRLLTYFHAGHILVGAILGLGAVVVAVSQGYEALAKLFK